MHPQTFLSLLLSIALLSTCKEGAGIDRVEASLRPDKQTTNVFYVFRDPKVAVLMDTDSDGDGKLDQRTWIRHIPGDDAKFQAFYQETAAENQRERLWYGPENLRLISREDGDGDGRFEQTVYYNRTAFSNTVREIVARTEFDFDGDGRTEAWYFPPIRLEVDTNRDGRVDRILSEPAAASAAAKRMMDSYSIREVPAGGSGTAWAHNPAVIPLDRYRSTMNSLSK